MTAPSEKASTGCYVWDPLVRIGHWLLVASVVAAWFTRHGGGAWHEWVGYAALAIVVLRLGWGVVGRRHARFSDFLVGPRKTLHYAQLALRCEEPHYFGHNPLGAWMIVGLIAILVVVTASGWLYTTDRFWGVAWVETLHSKATDVLIGLVALHVAGVLYASWRHRENLVAAMFHGRKRSLRVYAAAFAAITSLLLAPVAEPEFTESRLTGAEPEYRLAELGAQYAPRHAALEREMATCLAELETQIAVLKAREASSSEPAPSQVRPAPQH